MPRTSANWLGFDEARARFTEWLSREDIVFFFEHVLPRGADPHGRKKFWLHYVRAIHRSRPLLSPDDRARLIGIKKSDIGHFGRIEGLTSAFMLDFGKIVAVEFSKSGNACYVYARLNFDQIVPNFWDTRPFAIRDLKSRSEAAGWVIHDRDGRWYEELASFLARQGIRPSKETK